MAENKKQEPEGPRAEAVGPAVGLESEPEDLKFVRELFEKLEKKSLPELLEGLEKAFYRSGASTVIELSPYFKLQEILSFPLL